MPITLKLEVAESLCDFVTNAIKDLKPTFGENYKDSTDPETRKLVNMLFAVQESIVPQIENEKEIRKLIEFYKALDDDDQCSVAEELSRIVSDILEYEEDEKYDGSLEMAELDIRYLVENKGKDFAHLTVVEFIPEERRPEME